MKRIGRFWPKRARSIAAYENTTSTMAYPANLVRSVSCISWVGLSMSFQYDCIENRYTIQSMIQSFANADTSALHERKRVARWVNIEAVARRKLDQLDAASELTDLGSPPGNRLEALSGNRKGQYSIRINDQFRVCFVWATHGPQNVEIVDYH